jgi:hypothetical protein
LVTYVISSLNILAGASKLQTTPLPADNAIRPFQVHFPDEALADLRRRIA